MLSVRKTKRGLLFAILILLAAIMLLPSAPASAHTENTVLNFPIIATGDGASSGGLTITETTPGSLMAGQDLKFTFLNARLKGVVWDIYPEGKPEGITGAWIYVPTTVGGDINTIKGITVISQTPDSVTVRIDSVQAGDRGYLAIYVSGDNSNKGAGTIRPGNVMLEISPPPGTVFTESEAVKAQKNNTNFNPAPASQGIDVVPGTSLSYSGTSSVSMAVYGSTGSPAWPKLSHDNSYTSISPYTCSPSAVKWVHALEDYTGVPYRTFREAPVIGRNNVVYITGEGEDNLAVFAINPDGTSKWVSVLSTDGDYTNWSSLTLSDDGRLYIGTSKYGLPEREHRHAVPVLRPVRCHDGRQRPVLHAGEVLQPGR